jgi:hypothetical protein
MLVLRPRYRVGPRRSMLKRTLADMNISGNASTDLVGNGGRVGGGVWSSVDRLARRGNSNSACRERSSRRSAARRRASRPLWKTLRQSPALCKRIYCCLTGQPRGFNYNLPVISPRRKPAVGNVPEYVRDASSCEESGARADNPSDAISAILQTRCRGVALHVHPCFSRRPHLHCPESCSLG